MEARYFRCRNWHKFQHYPEGSRRLTWIKNWIELDDPSNPFSKLTFAEQGRLQAIWRLAAKLDNKIPWDEVFVARAIGAKRIPLGDLLDSKWIQVGTEKELKRLANAEKRAANRGKPASRRVAKREQDASLEVEEDKEKELRRSAIVEKRDKTQEAFFKLADEVELVASQRLRALQLGEPALAEAMRAVGRCDVVNRAAYFDGAVRRLYAAQQAGAWRSELPPEERLRRYVRNGAYEYTDAELTEELRIKGADGPMIARLLVKADEIRNEEAA
jgi:hypothetical protein